MTKVSYKEMMGSKNLDSFILRAESSEQARAALDEEKKDTLVAN